MLWQLDGLGCRAILPAIVALAVGVLGLVRGVSGCYVAPTGMWVWLLGGPDWRAALAAGWLWLLNGSGIWMPRAAGS